MTVQEFTQQKGSAQVSVHGDMSLAELKRAEDIARAEKTKIRQVTSSDNKSSKAEGRVYGDLLIEAVGGGMVKTAAAVVGLVDERASDAAKSGAGVAQSKGLGGTKAQTFDDGIAQIKRPAGAYRENPLGLVERANIAKASMEDQPVGLHGALKGTNTIMASVQQTKQITMSHELANEQALATIGFARQKNESAMAYAAQMSPGMNLSMANGPSFRRPSEIIAAADEKKESWRGGSQS